MNRNICIIETKWSKQKNNEVTSDENLPNTKSLNMQLTERHFTVWSTDRLIDPCHYTMCQELLECFHLISSWSGDRVQHHANMQLQSGPGMTPLPTAVSVFPQSVLRLIQYLAASMWYFNQNQSTMLSSFFFYFFIPEIDHRTDIMSLYVVKLSSSCLNSLSNIFHDDYLHA